MLQLKTKLINKNTTDNNAILNSKEKLNIIYFEEFIP